MGVGGRPRPGQASVLGCTCPAGPRGVPGCARPGGASPTATFAACPCSVPSREVSAELPGRPLLGRRGPSLAAGVGTAGGGPRGGGEAGEAGEAEFLARWGLGAIRSLENGSEPERHERGGPAPGPGGATELLRVGHGAGGREHRRAAGRGDSHGGGKGFGISVAAVSAASPLTFLTSSETQWRGRSAAVFLHAAPSAAGYALRGTRGPAVADVEPQARA